MAATRLERYVASMLLSGAGDAIGYKNGSFEFCKNGQVIHEEVDKMGGLENLVIKLPDWCVSDDTVMHLATAEALVESYESHKDQIREYTLTQIARHYITCMDDMTGRAPGATCIGGVGLLKPSLHQGYLIPFNPRGGGCGAAMRAMCIGLRYPRESEVDELIAVSVESGRMTHHNPTGFLGAVCAAYFTSCALQDKPMNSWGSAFMSLLPRVKDYIVSSKVAVQENIDAWDYFEQKWKNYLTLRGITDGNSDPSFPEPYGVVERDEFYKSISFGGWGGASGHDSTIIAYDALLGSQNNWLELCRRGTLHGGDNDSTGAIASAWFGALNGFNTVPPNHYQHIEYLVRLKQVGEKLCDISSTATQESH